MDQPLPCSHCGELISIEATFCRYCGSSHDDGWRDDDEALLDTDDFEYDEYVRENLSGDIVNTQTPTIWRIVAACLLALMLLGFLFI